MVLEFLLGLVSAFGYLGVFLGSLIGSASIFLPVPSFLFVFLAGKLLDPFLVGVVSGIGSAIGELTAYAVGFGIVYGKARLGGKKGRKKRRDKSGEKWFHRINRLFHGKHGFVVILAFAATPLPDDIAGLYFGAIRYDIRKFFLAMLIGKIILGLLIAYAGYFGIGALSDYFS